MAFHLHAELQVLRKLLLREAALVEDQVRKAYEAFRNCDDELAQAVVEADDELDKMEIEVEEECLKTLALHQPVAIDLRFIVTSLKINNDLERMGDIAVSIARRGTYLAEHDPIEIPSRFDEMARAVRKMVKDSLDCLVNSDDQLANDVCKSDESVDAIKREIAKGIRERMKKDPERIPALLKILDVTRHLERIGDLSTNVAEDVIYLARGEIVRHGYGEEHTRPAAPAAGT